MKKKYVKPMIVIEKFQLDGAIAASCSSAGKEALNFSITTCMHPGTNYFGPNCKDNFGHDVVTDETGNDEICYHAHVGDISDSYVNS